MLKVQQGPEPDWERASREWEKSSQNQMNFCRDRGFSYSQFKNARARLGHCRPKRKSRPAKRAAIAATKSSNLSFLPLVVEAGAISRGRSETAKGPGLEVELPFGVVLRFHDVDSSR